MATQIPATPSTVNLSATPDAQLEALRSKQAGYTTQLETNTTKAANVGRVNLADSLESQKNQAKQEAMAAGRPWTNADELQWNDRKARQQQQQENAMLLGREATVGASINSQGETINSQISQQLQQKNQQLQAQQMAQAAAQSQAQLQAQQEYQQAMLKLQEQQQALEQSKTLSQLMYGPQGPGGNSAFGAGGVQQAYGAPASAYGPGAAQAYYGGGGGSSSISPLSPGLGGRTSAPRAASTGAYANLLQSGGGGGTRGYSSLGL